MEVNNELRWGKSSALGSEDDLSEELTVGVLEETETLDNGGQSWRQWDTAIRAFFTAKRPPVICQSNKFPDKER